jgi:hypothetical protein
MIMSNHKQPRTESPKRSFQRSNHKGPNLKAQKKLHFGLSVLALYYYCFESFLFDWRVLFSL